MKILILSKNGKSAALAGELAREGNDVTLYTEDEVPFLFGSGIFSKTTSWRQEIPLADLIVCDSPGFGTFEEVIKRNGKPVLGCSPFADEAELNRKRPHFIFDKCGIPAAKTIELKDSKEMLNLALDWPEGGYQITGKSISGKQQTLLVMSRELLFWASDYFKGEVLCVQAYDGVEICVEFWFNGRSFLDFGTISLLYDGEGSAISSISQDSSIYQQTFRLLESMMRKISYRGPVNIYAKLQEEELFCYDISFGFEFETLEAYIEGLREPLVDVLFEVALGSKKSIAFGTDYCTSVAIYKRDYSIGSPIVGVCDENLRHLHFIYAFRGPDGAYSACSGEPIVAKATAHAKSISESCSRMYRTASSINFAEADFSRHVGFGADRIFSNMRKWNWL